MSRLKGEGVRWGVTKCDRGRGVQEHVMSRFCENFYGAKQCLSYLALSL